MKINDQIQESIYHDDWEKILSYPSGDCNKKKRKKKSIKHHTNCLQNPSNDQTHETSLKSPDPTSALIDDIENCGNNVEDHGDAKQKRKEIHSTLAHSQILQS